MAGEYLLELRCRELPAAFARRALEQLAVRLFEELMGRSLGPAEVVSGVSARRLVLCLRQLEEHEPDREERQLGPPVKEAWDDDGEPTEALRGFAERVGVAPAELERVKTERGDYLGAVRTVAGRPLDEVLAEVVPRALGEIEWRPLLGRVDGEPVRPVAAILSLLDGEVVPFQVVGVLAGGETAGHPVLAPEPFVVDGFEDYRRKLGEVGVEVQLERRRERLGERLATAAGELAGEVRPDPRLLDRLAFECEVPGVVRGAFPAEYLASLPEELVLAALAEQRVFGVSKGEDLLPAFLAVMDRDDDPAGRVRAGWEVAVAGGLEDVRFHLERDRSEPLAERARRLDHLPFHPRLGSYAEKTARLEELVELICGELGWTDEVDPARQAAALSKADLTSGAVREIPALRGTVGGLLAREEGYVEAVWRAVYDHYRPASAEAPIPGGRVGRALAVADRLDSLVGFLSLGPPPSGSKDPFALRRLAQGLLRILLEAGMELDLDLVAARAVLLYGERIELGAEETVTGLQGFLGERVRHFFGGRGFGHDEIEAAMAVRRNNLPDLEARLRALHKVRGEVDFRSLVHAARRISNILEGAPEHELEPELLEEEAEVELHRAVTAVRERVGEAARERRYDDCLHHLLELVPPLDRFFAEVLVMDENENRRHNRVALLQSCRRLYWRIARLKEMMVEKER